MHWYSRLHLSFCLFSIAVIVGVAGISSGNAGMVPTTQKSEEAVSTKDKLKRDRLNGESVNHQPSVVKPSTSQSAKVKPSNLKPSTPQSANVKPLNPKPSNLKPSNVRPSGIEASILVPIQWQATLLRPVNFQTSIFDSIVIQPRIFGSPTFSRSVFYPTPLNRTTQPTSLLQPTLLQPQPPQIVNLQTSLIQPREVKPGNLQAANLQPSLIQPAVLKPENLQAANLQASLIQPAALRPSNRQAFNPQQFAQIIPQNSPPSTSSPTNSGETPANPPTFPPSSTQQQTQENPETINPIAPDTTQNTETPSPSTPPSPTISPSSSETIAVEQIEVIGSTILDQDELNPILQPLEGRTVTLEELRGVADAISQLYLDRGFITSRAVLVEPISSGVVKVQVIEGSLQEIQVEGTRRLNPNYVRSRIRLGAKVPLNTAALEDQLRLLRIDPLFENVEASLRAGTELGQSILVVRVSEADPFDGSVGIDNYSPPSVGSERMTGNVSYRNLTGLGDQISLGYNRTTVGGAETWDLSYLIPINAKNGTIQLRASRNRNEVIVEEFRELDIRGESELYEINYRQPFIRTPREELALSLGFTFQDGQTFTFAGPTPFGIGPDEEGVSRTSVFKFGQDYTRRDVSGAWAFRSLFSFGTGLFNATENSESEIDENAPDGQFISWLAQIQRVQVLNPDNFLIIQADLQLGLDGLLPAQQFVIGGGQSVRGYRQNVRAGDNGFRISIEDRITLERDEAGVATFLLAPFLDVGYVWNRGNNPNLLQDKTFIAGLGLGLLWEPVPNLNLRLDYGLPLVELDDRGTNAQDEGFYFSVNYNF